MTTRYWIGVASREHVKAAKAGGFGEGEEKIQTSARRAWDQSDPSRRSRAALGSKDPAPRSAVHAEHGYAMTAREREYGGEGGARLARVSY